MCGSCTGVGHKPPKCSKCAHKPKEGKETLKGEKLWCETCYYSCAYCKAHGNMHYKEW